MKRTVKIMSAVAAVLCCSMMLAACSNGEQGCFEENGRTEALVIANYPEEVPYPGEDDQEAWETWWEQTAVKRQLETNEESLAGFFDQSAQVFLADAEGANKVYSPINTYLALAMLAETTEGNSRAQILQALGADEIETLRTQAKNLWNRNYSDDGLLTSRFADSLWLSDGLMYRQDTLDTLAENYYASSFSGTMGTDAYNQELQNWVNEQTGNLLTDQVSELTMPENTVLELLSASLFQARWVQEFNEKNNTEDTFHGANGDTQVTYMHQTGSGLYICGERFSATFRGLNGNAQMWFILPDEGVTVDELLEEGVIGQLLAAWNDRSDGEESSYEAVGLQQSYPEVHYSIPKFDVSAQIDMLEGLQAMGITDVFSREFADFSPLLEEYQAGSVYLSRAQQAARVAIDEEGVTAAAYVEFGVSGAGLPQDQVDFVLDRPFLFIVTGSANTPINAKIKVSHLACKRS